MKKALFIAALFLVPFLSQAFNVDSIFENGTVPTIPPQAKELYGCFFYGTGKEVAKVESFSECGDILAGHANSMYSSAVIKDYAFKEWSGTYVIASYSKCTQYVVDCSFWDHNFHETIGYYTGPTIGKVCPPDTSPNYVYPYSRDGGDILNCSVPDQIDLFDDCGVDNPDNAFNLEVTSEQGCKTNSNGSKCAFVAQDIDGEQRYVPDLEQSCYMSDIEDITNNNTIGQLPVTEQCTNNGGLVACPADPDVMCPNGECQADCGYVNNQFLCFAADTDTDGLPDYDDPDIDGDGVPNDQDLDSDGDGKDDPISEGGYNGGGGSTVNVEVDMSGVIAELKKANTSLDDLNANFATDHGLLPDELDKDGRLTTLNNDYETELNNFIAKGSSELGYVDKLEFTNDGKLVSLVPTDGCQNYSIPVGYFGTHAIDLCSVSQKVKPLLSIVFALLTGFYVFMRVNQTVRGQS